MQVKRRDLFTVVSLLIAPATRRIQAEERHWIARSAELIIVGRFASFKLSPQPGGWQIAGHITANRVLFGPAVASDSIPYRFHCSCCRSSAKASFGQVARTEGIWFLNRFRGGAWTSAGPSCSDPGYRPLSELDDMMPHIKARQR